MRLTRMMRVMRRAGAATGMLVLAAAALPLGAQTSADQGDARRPCAYALVAMEDGVDSAKAKSGDVFRFVLVDTVTTSDGTTVPQGTRGYGIVANASHAGSGGRGGYLALETRFFVLDDGRHVQAIIDRVNDQASSALGASGNAPGILGLIPIVGYAVGGYDSLHHGKDATIPRGTRVGVFVGDDAGLYNCRPPKAGETVPRAATPSPAGTSSSAPAPNPVPTAPASSAPGAPPTPPAPAMTPTASPTTAAKT
ncbi:MAG TPA: hypothetical protein VGX96_02780 [Candidatus Elarobacter sp.]|nr:hypothetical protein [Candidatus Elarobacter sp.]